MAALSRGERLGAVALGLFAVASLLWHLILPGSTPTNRMVSDILTVVAPAFGLAVCARAAWGSQGRERHGWTVMSAALLTWLLAESTWAFYEIGLDQVTPYPSIADVWYVLGVPLFVTGTVILTGTFRGLVHPVSLWDAAARVLVPAGVLWHFIIGPIFDEPGVGPLKMALSAYYPLTDLVLFVFTFAIFLRVRGPAAKVIGLLATAHFIMLATDLAYAWMTAAGRYSSGQPIDAAWIAAYLLMGVAAWLHIRLRPSYIAEAPASASMTAHLTPVVSLVAVACYSVVAGALGVFHGDPVGAALCVCAAVAVGARQVAILIENRRLTQELSSARTELEQRVAERTLSLARLETIIESTSDLVGTMTTTGEPLFLNRAGRRMMGLGPDDPLTGDYLAGWGASFPGLAATLREHRFWTGETTVLTATGAVPVSAVVLLHENSGAKAVSAIMRDITDQKATEAKLERLAHCDGLTQLLNRRAFGDIVEAQLAQPGVRPAALLFIDLDGFKYVNDSMGHRAGDDMLVAVADRIRAAAGDSGTAARLGGDEFAVFLDNAGATAARLAAAAISRSISDLRFLTSGRSLRVTASVGIALAPEHGTTLRDLLSNADLAMYAAKEQRDGYSVYSEALRSTPIDSQLVLEQNVRDAIDEGRLALVAQPIRHIASGAVHYELLLRIRTTEGEWLPPAQFLRVAERSGLIHQLDRWVVTEAARFAGACQRAGRPIALEVNVSGRAFADSGFLAFTREVIVNEGVDPTNLIFEITETAAIAEMSTARAFIENLRAIGCRFAIDDFGAGFSSFAYLKHLPVDFLKIDGSFVVDLVTDLGDQHLVRAMVELARGLGKETIAEFVGDEATVEVLRDLGVDYAQGYHIGEPVPLDRVLPEEARSARAA
ncbi:MAG: putative bifunctional diguanylate cyclase/phosphodiesterase [Dehalococcoidia bacterium]